MKIYIISTAMTTQREGGGAKILRGGSLVLTYLAGLCPDDVEIKLCDETYEKIDYSYPADLVALTAVTCTAYHAYRVAQRFKETHGSWTVIGGTHVTVLPEEAMEHCDTVVVGEGDYIFPKVIESVRKTGRAEPLYKNAETIALNGLPHPRRKLLGSGGIYVQGVQMTRGCQYRCEFCFIRETYGTGVRVRPVDEVIREIDETIRWRNFAFWDDNLIANRDHALALFKAMKPLNKRWVSQSCLDIADDPELLQAAAEAGCVSLFIGFDSFNERALRKMKKGFNKARTYKERIDKLHDAGIFVVAGVNFGSDEDDPFVFERTLEAIDYVGIDSAAPTICTPMPGTDLARRYEAEGRIFDHNWDHYDYRHVVFEPKKMTAEQLLEGHGWFAHEYYRWSRIRKRLGNTWGQMRMPFFFRLATNLGYRTLARKTSRKGVNPARNVVDGVAPPEESHIDRAMWADHEAFSAVR